MKIEIISIPSSIFRECTAWLTNGIDYQLKTNPIDNPAPLLFEFENEEDGLTFILKFGSDLPYYKVIQK